MPCERYRDALTDVAAGRPAPVDLEGHLASCGDCRSQLAALRAALAGADAELAGLLAAEPSPELAVRIRRAVAESEASPAWRLGWLWPATAVAATLLVALAVALGRGTGPAPVPRVAEDARPPQSAFAARGEEPAGEPLVPAVAAQPPTPVPPAASLRPRRAGRSVIPAGPEVLVPPGEAEALLRFAAHLQTRGVSPESLLVADLSAPLPELDAMEIQPLEIVPLDPAETSGTD